MGKRNLVKLTSRAKRAAITAESAFFFSFDAVVVRLVKLRKRKGKETRLILPASASPHAAVFNFCFLIF